jgi:hypothetical protein
MRTKLPLLAAITASLLASTSLGQETQERLIAKPTGSFAYTPPEAPHRHSSTYAEGVQRGQAALVRAWGDFSLQDSQAALIWEDVESRRLDNEVKLTETALKVKDLKRDHYHANRLARKLNKLELQQLKHLESLEQALDYQLTDIDFNWQTGAIYWPAAVASPQYAQHRQEIERLMARVIRSGSYVPEGTREEIAKACSRFRHRLHQDLVSRGGEDDPSIRTEYDRVVRLLKGLQYSPVLLAEAAGATLASN